MQTFYVTGKVSYAGAAILKKKLKRPSVERTFAHRKVVPSLEVQVDISMTGSTFTITRNLSASFVYI
jgi:hypothetical protein